MTSNGASCKFLVRYMMQKLVFLLSYDSKLRYIFSPQVVPEFVQTNIILTNNNKSFMFHVESTFCKNERDFDFKYLSWITE